jgi:hypothetical protein
VRCTRVAHVDGKDVDLCTWPVAADGIGEGGVFVENEMGCVG